MTVPAPVPASAPASVPGKTIGIVGLVLDFFVPILGLILSIVGKVQSNRAGVKNTPATVGIVLGILFTVGAIIGVAAAVAGAAGLASECANLGPGVHHVSGVTYTCS